MLKQALLEEMSISAAASDFCEKQEEGLREKFQEIDRIAEYNQWKVLDAFQKSALRKCILKRPQDTGIRIRGAIH